MNFDFFTEHFYNKAPYHYVSNNPVNKIDLDGHYELSAKDQKKYPEMTKYLKNGIGEILNNSTIMNGLMKYGGFTEKQIKDKIVKFGKGSIKLEVTNNLPFGNGYYMGDCDREILISEELVNQIENASTEEEKQLAILSFLITTLHESVHYGDWTYNFCSPTRRDFTFTDAWGYPVKESEIGKAFEIETFWNGDVSDFDDSKTGKGGMEAMRKIITKKMEQNDFNSLPIGIQNIINEILKQNPDVKTYISE